MINKNNISYLLVTLIAFWSCKKEEIEPIGFYQVDYYTSSEKDQSFFYYYDDGQLVANGLDEYMASVYSTAGTFNEEQILLLKIKEEISNFPDTLIPYTYFMGLNYQGEINKELTVGFNLDYPFNNPAHSDYLENEFFKANISKMKMIKVEYEGLADIYSDPDYTLEEYPFTINSDFNDVEFSTDDLNALYVLCWSEEKWSDSLSFSISGSDANTQEILHQGYRHTPIDAEGATYRNGSLVINYTPSSFISEISTNDYGWKLNEFKLKIANPSTGLIDMNEVELSMLVEIDNGNNTSTYTYLEPMSTTTIEILNSPNVNEYGELKLSGHMRLPYNQGVYVIDTNIKFKRQR